MKFKSIKILAVATVLAFVFGTATVASGELFGNKAVSNAPRYSETCAHGHNGFACDPPQYKIDISELQERTTELEKRVLQLERTR